MTLEPTDDSPKEPKRKSPALQRKFRIKRKNQLIRKRALEEKQRLYGSLSDEERGRLRELQDLYD